MTFLKRKLVFAAALLLALASSRGAVAIDIVLNYTLDANNENWFGGSPEGLARRASLDAAASFLSAIITNDDWNAVSVPNENLTFTDVAASSINDFSGNPVLGSPESDGVGFAYNLDVTNLTTVAANEYVVYIGAFQFDSGTSAHAKASWDSTDRRNAAGFAGEEFNTWGGKAYFDSGDTWYTGQNPGTNPTDNYGIQDPDKSPSSDISSDNWDWSTSSQTWKGFDLKSIDPTASGKLDLYATSLHELMHALGGTSSKIAQFLTVDSGGNFLGENVVAEFGGPVPGAGGHFAENVQSTVWNSGDIISEVTLDPNSLRSVRKYFTKLDAALLRDLGYQVVDSLSPADFNFDTLVDGDDLAIWEAGFGIDDRGDANGDGNTNGADFLLWLQQFGSGTSTLASSLAVPEPATSTLLLLATALLFRRKPMGFDGTHAN